MQPSEATELYYLLPSNPTQHPAHFGLNNNNMSAFHLSRLSNPLYHLQITPQLKEEASELRQMLSNMQLNSPFPNLRDLDDDDACDGLSCNQSLVQSLNDYSTQIVCLANYFFLIVWEEGYVVRQSLPNGAGRGGGGCRVQREGAAYSDSIITSFISTPEVQKIKQSFSIDVYSTNSGARDNSSGQKQVHNGWVALHILEEALRRRCYYMVQISVIFHVTF
ncbi:hypothetical protein M9H77_15638 [Catharanthus roseus]|uniref:Uncharacterized protein n=1 Tax=Catharanthus roseus TaxID=4058 RepID=A0ACC0AY41_CATRO|nr:hypothetical protein M9H77_15638 [Catharanthus roseus]